MNYAEIKYYDIANGPGVRVSLFVSGCTHACEDCFNRVAWDFTYGKPFDTVIGNRIMAACEPYYISGLSVLGGEPMEPINQKAVMPFLKEFKKRLPDKTVWLYTGCTYEELIGDSRWHTENTDEILELVDVLVDGRFEKELKDISLVFRGSSNQRIIDMNKTRSSGQIVIREETD
jgi:anaerobic ribonucleoside-triphosphate reductase activating protein